MLRDKFPATETISDENFTFRLMTPADRQAIIDFAKRLTEPDLLFMRRDITQEDAVDDWIRDIERQRAITILIETGSTIIGYGTLYYNQLFWNRHLGELRAMISAPYRNRGIGAVLARNLLTFAHELQLEKVITYMAIENKGARTLVEELGFQAEAILADWIKTRDERTHDLLIMGMSLMEPYS